MTLAKMFVAQGKTAQAAGNSVSVSSCHSSELLLPGIRC